jgi:hypothetical protein
MIDLTRLNSGLLYGRNNVGTYINPFVPGDEAHWDVPTVDHTVTVVSGNLYFYDPYSEPRSVFKNNQVGAVGEVCVMSNMFNSTSYSWVGVVVHLGSNTPASLSGIVNRLQYSIDRDHVFSEYNSGSIVQSFDWYDDISNSFSGIIWSYANGTSVISYDNQSDRDVGLSAGLSSGRVGVFGYKYNTIVQAYVVMSGRYITVSGLVSGDIVEIRKIDDTVLVSGSEFGGSATIDIYKADVTVCDKIVVVRSGTDFAQYESSAGDYICGGDTYIILSSVETYVTVSTGSSNLNPPPLRNHISEYKEFLTRTWEQWIFFIYKFILVHTKNNSLHIARHGVDDLVSGSIIVKDASITSDSKVLITIQELGTVSTPKKMCVKDITPGDSFTIQSSDYSDTSKVFWAIMQ